MSAVRERVVFLKQEIQSDNLWKDKNRAVELSKEFNDSEEELLFFEEIKKEIADAEEFLKLSNEDNSIDSELEKKLSAIDKKIKNKEIESYFEGKYDKGDAILSIYSGAGGQDAQDWAQMLFRMYSRYAERKNFKVLIIDESYGDCGAEGRDGLKSITIEISGKFAYGLLRKETGVHRLVRLSPFSAQKLRHTSFALVEILPEISDNEDIGLRSEDIKLDFYKASGPGGQYVNKRESAVRITHIPTGITVTCQSERLQGSNKEKALKILSSKLYQYKIESKAKELSEIKGDKVSASWGNQIRSYVLHPYKLVKDLRTGVESTNPDDVLDGNLDKFIEEEIKQK
ncbi:MAG: peptide chain release factor 2 [Candidatus Pacebacteria bacterium]|nr:peptide chain release factor 2 [Candidatus Paceibacterota bacterium]